MPKVPKTPTVKAPATVIPPALQPFGQPKVTKPGGKK
jgi:hypothetical protein